MLLFLFLFLFQLQLLLIQILLSASQMSFVPNNLIHIILFLTSHVPFIHDESWDGQRVSLFYHCFFV
jgi:hypothetical protein